MPNPGSPDLDFIQGLELSMKRGRTSTQTRLLSYRRPENSAGERNLTMPVHDSPNAADLWETNDTVYALTVWGVLPERAWVVDVTVSFTGTFEYQP